MQQSYVIGVDIGTGSTKAVAVTPLGKVLANAQAYYSTAKTNPLFSEQDPEIIWNAFLTTIKNVATQLQAPPLAVGLSSCMHSLVLVDKKGTAITPNTTWADRRSAGIAAALRSAPDGERIYKSTGTPLHAMSPLCRIRWYREHAPDLFQAAAMFISIKEYIWYKLFGVYEIDYSIASATGLFDIETLRWFPLSLQFCGVQSSRLSTPVATQHIQRNIPSALATALQIPATTPFCIGASDGCLANVGSYALEPGTAAVTIGTSGAVRLAHHQPIATFPDMLFNYRLTESLFICGGAVNNGGNVAQWLVQQFLKSEATEKGYAALFEQAAAAPAGSQGLLCLPYLTGERTPLWDEKACGVYFGFDMRHEKKHFIRAALEGVCYALHGILKKLERATGAIHTLHVSGGMVRSALWMQMLADVTGKKIRLLHTEDASALGGALLCMKALGITDNYIAVQESTGERLEPCKENHALYQKGFAVFEALYPALKATMHQLHDFNL
jgi:gluconokinase